MILGKHLMFCQNLCSSCIMLPMMFRFVMNFKQFKDLFAVDPLLLPMFYYLCSRQELPELFNISTEHPHLSIAWLAQLINKGNIYPDVSTSLACNLTSILFMQAGFYLDLMKCIEVAIKQAK